MLWLSERTEQVTGTVSSPDQSVRMENEAVFSFDEFPADEVKLLAASRHALSTPKSRVAVILHLSRLAPPLPRPHHRRIAWAVIEDVAHHHHGEMFQLGCGDIVLLCRPPSLEAATDPALHPTSLPHVLARLFRIDVPDGAMLTTVWMLERDGAELLGYAAQQAG